MKHWHPRVADAPLWTIYYQRWTAHLSAAAHLRRAVALTAIPRAASTAPGERLPSRSTQASLMRPEQSAKHGLVAEYYHTFLDWRLRYGLADPCMEELRAALLVECAQTSLTDHERSRLLSLADLISEQQRLVEQAA